MGHSVLDPFTVLGKGPIKCKTTIFYLYRRKIAIPVLFKDVTELNAF